MSAGAAAPTHGPDIENALGCPFWPMPPTVNTSGRDDDHRPLNVDGVLDGRARAGLGWAWFTG